MLWGTASQLLGMAQTLWAEWNGASDAQSVEVEEEFASFSSTKLASASAFSLRWLMAFLLFSSLVRMGRASSSPTSQPSRQPTSRPSQNPTSFAENAVLNLVQNPGAEEGNIKWVGLTNQISTGWAVYPSTANAHTGTYSFLTEMTTNVSMSQNLSLTIGSTYSVTIWLGNAGTIFLKCASKTAVMSVDGWPHQKFSTNFVARNSIESLGITGHTIVGRFFAIDDISVTVLQSPTSKPSSQPSRQPTRRPSSQPSSRPSQPSGQPSSQPTTQPSQQPIRRPSSQPSRQPSGKPSIQPSGHPSRQPSVQPTTQPTKRPSGQPSHRPTRQPSGRPSIQPSSRPSTQPSSRPTSQPSVRPSAQPSRRPSVQPTRQPSGLPTGQPTRNPSRQPTGQPTRVPSRQPTGRPSGQPSSQPGAQPSKMPSAQPSRRPSAQPSMQPSGRPSGFPTGQPTRNPSRQPTSRPSSQPSLRPSVQPSNMPSAQPSRRPSAQPSMQPLGRPSGFPTVRPSTYPRSFPTSPPSSVPSVQPTGQPTRNPSRQPTGQPTRMPSRQPTGRPSRQPSLQPSGQPTSQPSRRPTRQPSMQPTNQPSRRPSSRPSARPTVQPTCVPSGQPTRHPSRQPTSQPSRSPSTQPSRRPSSQPSGQPMHQPSGRPSNRPSAQPTVQPTRMPSVQPTRQPTGQPSRQPNRRPTSQPSRRPSRQPTGTPSAVPVASPTAIPSISQQPTTPVSYWTSYNDSASMGNQTFLGDVGHWQDVSIHFQGDWLNEYDHNGALTASKLMPCVVEHAAIAKNTIVFACESDNGESTAIANVGVEHQQIAWKETIALPSIAAMAYNPNVNTVFVVGQDAQSQWVVLSVDPQSGRFSGYAFAVSGYTPVITSAACGVNYPSMMVSGYTMRLGVKVLFSATFNTTGGVTSGSVLRGISRFTNVVAVPPCEVEDSFCQRASLEVGGFYPTLAQPLQPFMMLRSMGITFICQASGQLTHGVVLSTTGFILQAYAVGVMAEPSSTLYNSVLLAKVANNQVSTTRVHFSTIDNVDECKLSPLGNGFVVWCWAIAQGLGRELSFYIDSQLTVSALNSPYTVLTDQICSLGNLSPTILENVAVVSSVWVPPVPSVAPTVRPSRAPSFFPTLTQTKAPSKKPTVAPTESQAPTTIDAPTSKPTDSQNPTILPSEAPTDAPVQAPTVTPSEPPTDVPTVVPSADPSEAPTVVPSVASTTLAPSTAKSSRKPFAMPTFFPMVRETLTPILVNLTVSEVVDSKKVNVLPGWAGWTIGAVGVLLMALWCMASSDEGWACLCSLFFIQKRKVDTDRYDFLYSLEALLEAGNINAFSDYDEKSQEEFSVDGRFGEQMQRTSNEAVSRRSNISSFLNSGDSMFRYNESRIDLNDDGDEVDFSNSDSSSSSSSAKSWG
ncbi:MAG: PT domain-containing protein [Pseudomonadota bacterium]